MGAPAAVAAEREPERLRLAVRLERPRLVDDGVEPGERIVEVGHAFVVFGLVTAVTVRTDALDVEPYKTTVAKAGYLLEANGERHLKSPEDMCRLFARWPHAIEAARDVADACRFSLDELRYEYPEETCPEGRTPQEHLEFLTWQGAEGRYPDGLPQDVRTTLSRELELIGKLQLARYFLTIKDIVDFARAQDPPILCQGRGSAANSAVCYCLGITAVDPVGMELLFERFLSEERGEWPDIDLDLPSGDRRERVVGAHRGALDVFV